MGPNPLKSFKIMLESLRKGTMFTILWSKLRPTATVTHGMTSMGQTISSPSPIEALGNHGVVYAWKR